MAVYYCDLFFRNTTITNFAFLLSSLLIAGLTKATGILLFAVIAIFFIIKIFSQNGLLQKIKLSKFLIVAVLVFISVVIYLGGYYTYFKKYNDLPSCAVTKVAPPSLFTETNVTRPGIMSIASGYFTFRYLEMIEEPYIDNNNSSPLQRTSLWSSLYGRTLFMQFDEWPPSWQTKAPVALFFGRILIALGIIPLLLFLWGFYKGIVGFFKGILKTPKEYLREDNNYLHLGITIAFMAAIVKYSYDYRDFSTMKSIYLFPGLISYIKLFSDGYTAIKWPVLLKSINIILVIIIAFSIADIGHLIYQLQYNF
jgi:hypothetical protein